MRAEYYCPKCDSTDIDIICLNPPLPHRISMDELGGCITIPLIHKVINYKAICKNCGYTREYLS